MNQKFNIIKNEDAYVIYLDDDKYIGYIQMQSDGIYILELTKYIDGLLSEGLLQDMYILVRDANNGIDISQEGFEDSAKLQVHTDTFKAIQKNVRGVDSRDAAKRVWYQLVYSNDFEHFKVLAERES